MSAMLWACVGSYWVAGARSLFLRYPIFATFILFGNAIRGTWFNLDPVAYRHYWEASNWTCTVLQVAVTLEAYWFLARQVPNFAWRWRVLAVLALPGIVLAGVLALEVDKAFRVAMWFNQVAGFGLGMIAALCAGLGSVLPLRLSRNSIIHAAVIAVMWLSSAVGYRLFYASKAGWWIAAAGPALAALAWAVLMRQSGETQPPADPPELIRAAEEALERQTRRFEAGSH